MKHVLIVIDLLRCGRRRPSVLITARRRFVSDSVFRNAGRQTFEPPAQIIRQDERGLAALYRAEFTVRYRIVNGRPANARDRARLVDLECNGVGLHCLATVWPGSARQPRPYNPGRRQQDAILGNRVQKDKGARSQLGTMS